jgi:hypothetical protein
MTSRILWQSSALSLLLVFGCSKQPTDSGQAENDKVSDSQSHSAAMPFHAPRPFSPGPDLAKADRKSAEYYRAWTRFNIVEEYRRCGKTNSAWDTPALQSLELYCEFRALDARDAKQNEMADRCLEALNKATAAGCNDPLVKYLQARVVSMRKEDADEQELQKSQIAVAETMEKWTMHQSARRGPMCVPPRP